MKKSMVILCAALIIFGCIGTANATLYDRGGGLIYDDVLDITWLQDANYAATTTLGHHFAGDIPGLFYWDDAPYWVDELVYGGYDDWRLPTTVDGTASGAEGRITARLSMFAKSENYRIQSQRSNHREIET